jgi:hypothetical protein
MLLRALIYILLVEDALNFLLFLSLKISLVPLPIGLGGFEAQVILTEIVWLFERFEVLPLGAWVALRIR